LTALHSESDQRETISSQGGQNDGITEKKLRDEHLSSSTPSFQLFIFLDRRLHEVDADPVITEGEQARLRLAALQNWKHDPELTVGLNVPSRHQPR